MAEKFTYKTHGVCSRNIHFELEDGKVRNVKFDGGCRGNTQGLSALAEGMAAEELIARLEGTQCRGGTSCPDQLAKAVKEALAK